MDLLKAGTSIELLIDERVLETSAEQFPSALERAVEREDVAVAVHPDRLSAGLLAFEGTTCVVAYDDSNTLRAMLVCEDEPAVAEWASEWFDRVWTESEPIETVIEE
jgi:predicted transcriptional regulator